MSNIDKQALREAAEKATKGNYVVGHNNINQRGHLISVFVCQEWRGEAGGVVAECHVNCLTETSEQVYANAEFIAVANPRTMLALLDELEAAEKRIAELEARVIVLPQRLSPEGYHIDEAYMVDDTEGEYLDRDAVIDAIRAAGIKVKGE
ncbi:ead/Ea22-like family protein [Salmonella enterica]|nr:ead/Ea22-like family protein [Salmonella enterica]ELS2142997.1 ead/Ea22-like family protein [Salmonella enterica]ELY7984109.1 ead/Ea22-like family protein [Salmonella enterica]